MYAAPMETGRPEAPRPPGAPGPGRRERKKQAVRQSIVDAAETLFSEQGIEATTVDQIASVADISQTTFFNYFPTKTALLDALIANLVALFDGILEQAQGTDAPIEQAVQSLFRSSAELTEVQHRLLRDLIAETIRLSTPGARQSLGHMRSVFAQSLIASQETHEIRDDCDADLLADAVLGIYIAVFLFWSADADYPVADRLRETIALVMDLTEPRP
jgi:AcrR family transcriptional regulator